MKITTRNVQFRDSNGRMVSSAIIANGSLHDEVVDYLDNNPQALGDAVVDATESWLAENITEPSQPAVDASLSVTGAAADAKKTGEEISGLKACVNGFANVNNEHFFGDEISVTMNSGTRGGSSGASVNVVESSTFSCSSLIPVSVDDTFTFVNLMPDKYKFVIRGYSDNEENSGTFVSAGGPVALDQDGTEGSNLGSVYSNTVTSIYKNTVAVGRQKNAAVKYLSLHVRLFSGYLTESDRTNIQNCFKIYKGIPTLNPYYLPIVSYDRRTILGNYGEIVTYSPVKIDTVNKTMSLGNSFTLKSGALRKNTPAIDLSGLDVTKHQTIYYDADLNTILVTNYDSYSNLSNVNNTVYLGSIWASNTLYPDGFFMLNSEADIIVNGKRQLMFYDYMKPNNSSYKSMAMFGDSIMQGQTTDGNKTQYLMQDLIPPRWGIDVTNYAVGGSGWCRRGTRTSDLAVMIPQTDVSGFDFILLFSGTNDYGANLAVGNPTDAPSDADGAGFCASVKYVLDNIFTQNPDVEVAIVTPTFRNYQSSGGVGNAYTEVENSAGNTLGDFCDALVAIGAQYNVPVYDMRKNSIINFRNYASMLHEQSTGSGLYLHPKDVTYKIMNHKIMNWLESVY